MGENTDRLRDLVSELDDTKNNLPSSESQPSIEIALKCDVCGRQDETVRLVQYPFVISIIFVTFRRAISGAWCRRHQWPRLLGAGVITALLGWLGIPYGFLYTPVALVQLARGGICPREANADLLTRIATIKLQAGRRDIAVKSLINALEFSDTPEIRQRLEEITASYYAPESQFELRFGSFVFTWGILGAMILIGVLIGLINFGLALFFVQALPSKVNIFVAILTWAPTLAFGFMGGLLIQVGVQGLLWIHQSRHWLPGILVGLISPLLAWYSIVLGGNVVVFIRDLLSGDVYKSTQEALGYLGSILTVGGYERLVHLADSESYLWLGIWLIIGIYFFWSGIYAARRHGYKMKFSESVLTSPATTTGLSLTPIIAIGVFVVGVAAAFLLFAQPLGEAAVTEETIDHLEQGLLLLEQGQMIQARSEFNQALEVDPGNAEAYFGKGITYYVFGQYEPALEAFQHAIDLSPQDAENYAYAGICLAYLERSSEASEYLETALEIQPDGFTTYVTYFGFGLVEIANQDLDAAINYFDQALALYPEYFEARFYLMLAYVGNSQFQDCAVLAQDLSEFDESWSAPLAIHALCLYEQGEMEASEASLEQALARASSDLLSQAFEIRVLMDLRRFDEAMSMADMAMENVRTETIILDPWIMLYAMHDRSEEALQVVDELIAQAPENPDLHKMRSLALAYLGRFDEAHAALEVALSHGGEPSSIYESMSYIYFYQEEYGRAYQTAVRSLEYNENNAIAYVRLALAAHEMGYIEEACQAASTANSLVPMRDLVHYALGLCYYASGNMEEARSELELFLELYVYRPNADLHYENAINLLEELDA